MIRSVRMQGFRGFQNLALDGLAAINVVVGPNASGKTALLEGIFLASGGTPQISLRFRAWRGMGENVLVGGDRSSFESLWNDLFFGQEGRPAYIELQDTIRGKRSCRIAYSEDSQLTLPPGERLVTSEIVTPLTIHWEADGKTLTAKAEVSPERGLVMTSVPSVIQAVFVHSGQQIGPEANAQRYSELSKANRERGIVEAVQKLFPMIRSLSVEIGAGTNAVYASVEGLERKLPLPLVSAGINKYLSILLSIRSYPSGIVLIDELENGFYYATMEPLLSSIVSEAQVDGNQLFMTVHGMECMRALLPSIEKHPELFHLVRTRRLSDGRCDATQFPGVKLAAALEEGFEIR